VTAANSPNCALNTKNPEPPTTACGVNSPPSFCEVSFVLSRADSAPSTYTLTSHGEILSESQSQKGRVISPSCCCRRPRSETP
jgi:hypothetical protein